MSYPTYKEIERPLLRFILQNGGADHEVHCSATYEPLADNFGLSHLDRKKTRDDERFDGRNECVWHNMVQWARKSLVKQGALHRSRKGMWKLTEAGIRLAAE